MAKITKSFRIDAELWKKIKVHVAQFETDISSFIEDAVKKQLKDK
jgi:hypothetical protein